jgi:hypothetical protein
MAESTAGAAKPAEQQQVRVHIDERNLKTTFSNFFRSNGTAEEVILDFGINVFTPPAQANGQPEISVQIGDRVVLGYFTAKKLALALGQLIHQYEEQFGELELDVAKRRKTGK